MHPLLTYPLDGALILAKKRAIRRELLADGTPRIHKKIAVLGGSTTHDVAGALELFLLDLGIEPAFYQSEYGRYFEDAMFPNPELEAFAPDLIVVYTSNRNIRQAPAVRHSEAEADALFEGELARFRAMWERLQATYRCPVIQNNFELPFYRLLGNRDSTDARGRTHFTNRLNAAFAAYAVAHPGFYIHDLCYLAGDYGLRAFSDPAAWNMYKYCCAVEAIPHVAFSLSHIVGSIYGKNKKAMVLDLDNTLWGGVVGDDGVDGISIGEETPAAQSYSAFQRYIKEHKDIGVMLAVSSKNDRDNAIAGLLHPAGVLRPDDFLTIRANWEPKDQNVRAIAEELGVGADSFVFIDDNPAEQALIRAQIPGAAVPPLPPEAERYIEILDRSGFFEVVSLSEDDLARGEMYRQNQQREQAAARYEDYDSYLRSLEMRAEIAPFSDVYLARIAQLTNKTNQFNLTTRRYTEREMAAAKDDPDSVGLYGRLADKFGDNGVVTVVLARVAAGAADIDLWLMSCRVLGRGMESAMLDELAAALLARGVRTLRGRYVPTAKNGMVKDFYSDLGFALLSREDDGTAHYALDLAGYRPRNDKIEVNGQR